MSIGRIILCVLSALCLHTGCSQKNKESKSEIEVAAESKERVEEGKSLMLDKESVDFGVIVGGDILSRKLKVRNVTDKTVHIAGITSDCECTQVKMATEELSPREISTIEVILDTHGLIGRQYHRVELRTNVETYEIAVTAVVEQ